MSSALAIAVSVARVPETVVAADVDRGKVTVVVVVPETDVGDSSVDIESLGFVNVSIVLGQGGSCPVPIMEDTQGGGP